MEDWSSCAQHHHRIWSTKKVSAFCQFYPLEVRGFSAIAEKNPRNRGEKSPQSRRKIPAIAEKNPRDRV